MSAMKLTLNKQFLEICSSRIGDNSELELEVFGLEVDALGNIKIVADFTGVQK